MASGMTVDMENQKMLAGKKHAPEVPRAASSCSGWASPAMMPSITCMAQLGGRVAAAGSVRRAA